MRRIRRGARSGLVFIVIGVVLAGFGYTFYSGQVRYSGLMLMIMGIVSIAFGAIIVGYSTQIKRKYME